jgi:hypothetical protein
MLKVNKKFEKQRKFYKVFILPRGNESGIKVAQFEKTRSIA